jgi:hypothetical protein
MYKTSSDTFIHEIPLVVDSYIRKEIYHRFEAGRHLYNACLCECLKRIALMKQSKVWKQAIAFSRDRLTERRALFREARKQYGFTEYSLHTFVSSVAKNCWIAEHLDSFTIQKIGTASFVAAEQFAYGHRGKPRFRGYGRYRSIEGKSNSSGLRWRDGHVVWNVKKGKSLKIPVRFDRKDKYEVESHVLSCRIKYLRLIRKHVKGKERFYVQLVVEGSPKMKPNTKVSKGRVGIDIGPSTIAAVSLKTGVILEPFCLGLAVHKKRIRRIQRKMDRSKRKTNPGNYNKDKTIKKGILIWNFSKHYRNLKEELSELQRKYSQTRKRLHGELVRRVLSLGNEICLEKLSYKKFQRDFGRSVGLRAPGLFVSILRRKAERAGGMVEEFSPYKTYLSQRCHCGKRDKKSLSERWHRCCCGVIAQRDLYSAYLALFVDKEKLDTSQALLAWPATGPLLEHAVSRLNQLVRGQDRLSTFGFGQSQNQSHVKGGSFVVEAVDVVGESRELQRDNKFASRTP